MNRTTLGLAALLLLCFALPAVADEAVLGKWESTIESPRGTNDIVMEFKGSDEELSGTWKALRGAEELADIKVEGGLLTFKRHLNFQGNEVTISYECKVDGDTMSGKMITPRGEREFSAKKTG